MADVVITEVWRQLPITTTTTATVSIARNQIKQENIKRAVTN